VSSPLLAFVSLDQVRAKIGEKRVAIMSSLKKDVGYLEIFYGLFVRRWRESWKKDCINAFSLLFLSPLSLSLPSPSLFFSL
jgi:hypothetical protein